MRLRHLRIAVLLLFIPLVLAVPSLPYEAWGKITINGEPAPDGLSVEAYIDGIKYTTTYTINGYYLIDIQGDDLDTLEKEGGINGDTITIKVNGDIASPTLTWQSSLSELSERVDLTVETDEPPEPENHAPILDFISDITVTEGDLIQISASASDEDNDDLTYSIDDFRFTKNDNVFIWQTNIGDADSYTVTVSVSDGSLGDSQQVHIIVNQQNEGNGQGGGDNNQEDENNNKNNNRNSQDGNDYIKPFYKKDNKKTIKENDRISLTLKKPTEEKEDSARTGTITGAVTGTNLAVGVFTVISFILFILIIVILFLVVRVKKLGR